jgi:hypothetical protein
MDKKEPKPGWLLVFKLRMSLAAGMIGCEI